MSQEEIRVPIGSQRVGILGEELFKQPGRPPKRLEEELRKFCRDIAPEWVIPQGIRFNTQDEEKRYIAVKDGKEIGWDCDAIIKARYNHSHQVEDLDYFEFLEEHGSVRWEYQFLVELKTGGASLDYQNQREVMEYYAAKDGTQPLYIHLEIDDLPESFLIDKVQFL